MGCPAPPDMQCNAMQCNALLCYAISYHIISYHSHTDALEQHLYQQGLFLQFMSQHTIPQVVAAPLMVDGVSGHQQSQMPFMKWPWWQTVVQGPSLCFSSHTSSVPGKVPEVTARPGMSPLTCLWTARSIGQAYRMNPEDQSPAEGCSPLGAASVFPGQLPA